MQTQLQAEIMLQNDEEDRLEQLRLADAPFPAARPGGSMLGLRPRRRRGRRTH